MPADCAGPLKKEKAMVISAPSAKFGKKIGRIELVETGLRLFHH
jgi:hypothetical protein